MDVLNNTGRLSFAKLQKIEDVVKESVMLIINNENQKYGIQIVNQVKALIPLNADEKLIYGDMKKWDLSMAVKVALKYPIGSTQPMKTKLLDVRSCRNALAHPESHCLDDSKFRSLFSDISATACAIGIHPIELDFIWYEDLRADYKSKYDRAIDCARTAYMKGEFGAELNMLQYALQKQLYSDQVEWLRLLNLSMDASKRLQRPNLVAYYQNLISSNT